MFWVSGTAAGANLPGTFGFAIFALFFGTAVCTAFVAVYCYFATFLMHFYSSSSSGMDKAEFEGEITPFDYFINGLWLFAFLFVATLPGFLLGNLLTHFLGVSLVMYVMMRASHWLFFPIFFLSSMEEGSMFAVLAKNTIISLYRQPYSWLRFYLLTGVLFAFSELCFILVALWLGLDALIQITLFLFLFGIQALFFFRLLGRLAWLLEETERQKYELEYEQIEQ
jgi:hypothetical protein